VIKVERILQWNSN